MKMPLSRPKPAMRKINNGICRSLMAITKILSGIVYKLLAHVGNSYRDSRVIKQMDWFWNRKTKNVKGWRRDFEHNIHLTSRAAYQMCVFQVYTILCIHIQWYIVYPNFIFLHKFTVIHTFLLLFFLRHYLLARLCCVADHGPRETDRQKLFSLTKAVFNYCWIELADSQEFDSVRGGSVETEEVHCFQCFMALSNIHIIIHTDIHMDGTFTKPTAVFTNISLKGTEGRHVLSYREWKKFVSCCSIRILARPPHGHEVGNVFSGLRSQVTAVLQQWTDTILVEVKN